MHLSCRHAGSARRATRCRPRPAVSRAPRARRWLRPARCPSRAYAGGRRQAAPRRPPRAAPTPVAALRPSLARAHIGGRPFATVSPLVARTPVAAPPAASPLPERPRRCPLLSISDGLLHVRVLARPSRDYPHPDQRSNKGRN
ncbi:hypothetical protein BDA96_09G129900 [Sorghum bicolor]|uniref:Uncharacterized protein n=1 Tax=Sorghum bicolor TaxID=4558 RepID=A0A921U4L5_SORBI|nr:hypothetical protein BDA96_09G129900 [Sorghum bicolor]